MREGMEFVAAAYLVTALVLLAYGARLFLRRRRVEARLRELLRGRGAEAPGTGVPVEVGALGEAGRG